MVAHKGKEEIVKTTVSLSPAGDIIGLWSVSTVPRSHKQYPNKKARIDLYFISFSPKHNMCLPSRGCRTVSVSGLTKQKQAFHKLFEIWITTAELHQILWVFSFSRVA